MRLPKSKKAGNTRTKASIAFFIIAQLILAIFASSTAIAASIKYDDSYTYDGGSSSDGIAWGDSSLDTKLSGYPSGTQVVCFDWCSGDSKFDHCYGKSGDIDTCRKGSKTLDDVCKAGNCVSLGWFGSVGDWHPIDTGNAGERWTCAISARYYYACKSSGSYSYGDSGYTDYYITYPRRYDCDGDKTKTYDDKAYYGSSADKQIRSDISCSGSRLCDEDKDDSSADYGLYGTSKPNEPCSVPDEKEDCNSDSDCFSGSKCDCDDWWDCTWDVGSDEKDYCCPSGQKWDGSKCATPCTDNDGDGHKDSSCGGDDCNDADSGVWKKNTCGACAKEPSGIGDSCAVGVGACQKTGKYKCDTAGTGIECDVSPGSPSTETCNSVDDDCDGETDEGVKNACGSCGDVPSETCGDGKDNDCDGSIDEGCCTDPKEPYYCAKTSSCWASKAQCDQAITCSNVWVACKKPEGNVIKCVRDVPGCCNAGVPYFCPESGYCFSSDTYCDGRKVENCNGKYQICNKKTDEGKCFGDTLRCCPSGETWWDSDKQCHKSSEPQKCSVPDGTSANCDCDSDSECAKADPSRPYCEENYPSPISDGHDGCIASPPEYCGNGNCGSGEDYKNCASDCGQNAPKGTINVDVYYSSGANANKPISGAYVYLDGIQKGMTDSGGKINFVASYGSRNVKVECPDGAFCAEKTVGVDGAKSVSFGCSCNPSTDSDGDGYSNEDEGLLGTDPKDDKSYPEGLVYNPVKCITDGISILLIWLGGNHDDLIQAHTSVVQTLSSSHVSSVATSERPVAIVQALQQNHPNAILDVQSGITIQKAVERAEYIDAVLTRDELLYIISDNETQTTAIVQMKASCVGTIFGAAYGVGRGIKDDLSILEFPVMAVKALIFVVTHADDLSKIYDGFLEMVDGFMGVIKNFDFAETRYHLIKYIFEEGKKTNIYREDIQNNRQAYYHYQLGFFSGYVTGYIVEQVIFLKVAFAAVKTAFKASGKLLSRLSGGENIPELLAAVTKHPDLGVEIAKKVNNLPYVKGAVQLWTSGELTMLGKLTKYNEKWVKTLTKAEAQNVLRITKNIPDANLEKLVSSKLGQHTLKAADATEDLIVKQSKLVEKWGVKTADDVISKCVLGICYGSRIDDLNKILKAMPDGIVDDFNPERAVKFLGKKGFGDAIEKVYASFTKSELDNVVKGVDDFENVGTGAEKILKHRPNLALPKSTNNFPPPLEIMNDLGKLENVKGADKLAHDIAVNGLGHPHAARRAVILKETPSVKLLEIGKETRVKIKYQGNEFEEILEMDIFYERRVGNKVTKVIEEVASKETGVIGSSEKIEKQILKMTKALEMGLSDEAKLVTKGTFDIDVIRFVEQNGNKVQLVPGGIK